MVKHMVISLPLGVLDRATPSLWASSSYVLKAFQLSSIRLPILKLFMVYPFVRAAQTSPTYSLQMTTFSFCKATTQQYLELIQILNSYEAASGQKVNADKSSIFFSPNTPNDVKEEILSILGPMQYSQPKKYLGLPSLIGKSKNQVFAEIKERVSKKLASWKEKLLSIEGRDVLIKSVAQAMPTYTMSCIQLPKTLCDDLERMMRNFWWGQRNQESKLVCVSWKKLCKSKLYGGMGFQNLQAFNQALFAKQG
nr:uncharacterized protein LOC112024742 [Quercus suber]